jgi:hypothetical protein
MTNDDEKVKNNIEKIKSKLEEAKSLLSEEEIRYKNEFRTLLLSFFFIIKNLNREKLKKWWKSENRVLIIKFFNILNNLTKIFQYQGILIS